MSHKGKCNLLYLKNAHLHQIARKIMLLLVDNLHEKSITVTVSHDRQNFDKVHTISNLHNFVTILHSCYMKMS